MLKLNQKIFILGLPRTGTTSLCHVFLQHHFLVAHTAFTEAAFEQANVIADTPVFSDFCELNTLYPNSIWMYLHRDFNDWLPSITLMLDKLKHQPRERFHPLIIRSFERSFGPLKQTQLTDPEHLAHCYAEHFNKIKTLAVKLNKLLITVELVDLENTTATADFSKLIDRINNNTIKHNHGEIKNSSEDFERLKIAAQPLNKNGKITDWQAIKHPSKIPSHLAKNGRRTFFNYSVV